MTPTATSVSPVKTLQAALARLDTLRRGHVSRFAACAQRAHAVCHAWSTEEVDAVQVALVTQRPLLLRGEPGSGKTQLAVAAAHELGWALHGLTVYPRMEPQEVCYRFDAVERLAYAHDPTVRDQLHSTRFYEPGPLWWALDWPSAVQAQALREGKSVSAGGSAPAGHVVLIDEIDKADADLPNSLLEVFGERRLTLPCPPHRLRFPDPQEAVAPLVVLTTNEDRQLPTPFLRWCVVLSLEVKADDAEWLVTQRGMAHFNTDPSTQTQGERPYLLEAILREAAKLLCQEREAFKQAGLSLPGVAEYLDLLTALHALQQQQAWSDADMLERTRRLARYLFRKHGGPDVPDDLQQWHQRSRGAV